MASTPQRIGELQRELTANPSSRQFYQLGELLRRDGRAAEAVTVLRSGLAYHPRYVAAWVSLGRAYLEISQAAHAAQSLDSALGLDPANPVAWRLLGEARLMLGSRLGALDAMQRALDLAPGDEVLASAVEALAAETAPPAPELAVAPPVQPVVQPPLPRPPAAPRPFLPQPIAPRRPVTPQLPPRRPLEALPDPFAAAAESGQAGDSSWDVFAGEPVAVLVEAAAAEAPAPEVFGPGPESAATVPAIPEEAALQPEEPTAPEPEAEPFGALESEPAVEPEREPTAAEPAAVEPAAVEPEPAAPLAFPARPTAAPAAAPATVTLARLYLQQQQLGPAIEVLERVLARDPSHQEARDLLALVRDMMEPLPEPLPPLSMRERKIAALQRWLASITLARERART